MLSLAALLLTGAAALPAWEFSVPGELPVWTPNSEITATVEGGTLTGKTTGGDPILACGGLEIPATPWQYLLIRIHCGVSGTAQIFWTGDTSGPLGGLSEEKSARFPVTGGNKWQEIAVVPGWHREGTIKTIRFDLYGNTDYAVDFIRVVEWGGGAPPLASAEAAAQAPWEPLPGSGALFAPPLRADITAQCWAALEISAAKAGQAELLWVAENAPGLQSESFELRPGSRVYNVELSGHPAWMGNIAMLGVRLPEAAAPKLLAPRLAARPTGPAELSVRRLGFENGVNRAGGECSVLCQIMNVGGGDATLGDIRLDAGKGLAVLSGPAEAAFRSLPHGEPRELLWRVRADKPGAYPVYLRSGTTCMATASLTFLPPVSAPRADYVPVPSPVPPTTDLCMYYFPGWNSDAKWDCIRRVAPVRKPLLGYYDESNPECVDWQIKWAVENGINCFLVDWYWSDGGQALTHWFEAYRKSRYRDQLKVAVMWANHNAPNTHSRGDWRKVTQEWIDRYFNLPAYYRVNGKPAMFLWAPGNLRSDLGGSAEVRAALEESQAMARAAGYDGIEFIAMSGHDSPAQAETLLSEGFAGATTYHEWGRAVELSPMPNRARYADAAATAPEAWEKRRTQCGALAYYPVVDTGWDSRPWHGDKSLVLEDRTAADFEKLLRSAKDFAARNKSPFIVLGPANEWGEGSYVEPCTEYGFDMYEAVRRVFANAPEADWPVNIGPADVGLGPYDFPPVTPTLDWTFEKDAGGWTSMMNLSPALCANGVLSCETLSPDPALVAPTAGLIAADRPVLRLRMKITASPAAESGCQIFWSAGGSSTSEACSLRIPVQADGQWHDYTVGLSENPRWRGRISMLRLDPCDLKGALVEIDRISFLE